MTWKIKPLAIRSRPKIAASAVLYGLSLAVRFTSAAGEEVEIPTQSLQRAHPMMSVLTRNDAQLPYQDWGPKSAQPIVFRHGWPRSPVTPACTSP